MPKNKTRKINKLINNKTNKITQKLTTKVNKLKKTINKTMKAPNKKFIPAANTKNMNKDFRILYQDGTTVKVTGRDLVYAIPDNLAQQNNTDIITVIPANPCYWSGTRISALAQGYQNYRPLSMKFSYIPQCAVTQQGNVIAGTLWNQAPANDNLQQSLRTSNGGQLRQCYKQFTSVVRLKSNLQYNLYKTAGQFDQESNPFLFMSIAVGCKNTSNQNIIPGYFYVTWAFLLKNPIGNTNIFYNSGITTYSAIDKDYENKTIVFLTPADDEIQRGTILQLEEDEENQVTAYYNGSAYEMQDTDLVWYFANSTIQQTAAVTKALKPIVEFEYTTTPAESNNLETNFLLFSPITEPQSFSVYILATDNGLPISFDLSSMVTAGILANDTPVYFWNTPFQQQVPTPIINLPPFYQLRRAPGYSGKYVYEFKGLLVDYFVTEYKPYRTQTTRNKGLRRKVKNNINKQVSNITNIKTIKPQNKPEPEEDIHELFEDQNKPTKINNHETIIKDRPRSQSKSRKYCNTILEEIDS